MDDFEKYLREADLEALENFTKGIGPAPEIYKAGFVKPSEPGGPMVFVASEETEDRLGDVISADGWALEAFKQNPVFMWAHDHTIAPLGTVPKVWVEGKQLLNMVAWDEADELARFIKGKYERRVLRAESVGFRPTQFEDNGKTGGIHFMKQELLEISGVSIPAHPKALAKAMGGKRFAIIVPELVKAKEEPPAEEILTEKPYPNEHACRLKPPADFQPDSFKRTEREHEGKKYSVIMGRLKGETTITEQAYRYPKDTWESDEAKSHCESHDGSFEAAGEEEIKSMEIDKAGAVLNRSNKNKLSEAVRLLQEVIATAEREEADKDKDIEVATDADLSAVSEALSKFTKELGG